MPLSSLSPFRSRHTDTTENTILVTEIRGGMVSNITASGPGVVAIVVNHDTRSAEVGRSVWSGASVHAKEG